MTNIYDRDFFVKAVDSLLFDRVVNTRLVALFNTCVSDINHDQGYLFGLPFFEYVIHVPFHYNLVQ